MTDEWTSEPLSGIVHDEIPVSMDPQVRNLFVAGLLSGRYAQGYNRLRTIEDEFSVLGVLCDIATKVKVCAWDRLESEYFIAPLLIPATGAFLPPVVREWAKIKGSHPSQELPLVWQGAKHPIWRLGDIFHLSFEEIGYLVKAQY
jgi:hypothetical protein